MTIPLAGHNFAAIVVAVADHHLSPGLWIFISQSVKDTASVTWGLGRTGHWRLQVKYRRECAGPCPRVVVNNTKAVAEKTPGTSLHIETARGQLTRSQPAGSGHTIAEAKKEM